jgi:hypothetical protein
MSSLDQKYELFGTRLAVHLQRLYRGQCGRAAAKLEQWQRYQTCAFIIQRAYREHVEWHEIITHTVLRNLQQNSYLSQNLRDINMKQIEELPNKHSVKSEKSNDIKKPPAYGVPIPILQPTSVNFARCLRNKATFDEKLSVWRAIIELRRGHPNMSTHICMKAMLESNGDISRAMVLMGDETYHLKNEGDVPLHLRTMFMPYLRDVDYLPKASSPGGSPDQQRDFQESFRGTVGRSNTGNSIGLDGIRKLKAAESSRRGLMPVLAIEDDAEDSGLDLTEVVAWSYFSKYFKRSTNAVVPPCCQPNPVQHVPSCKPINAEEIAMMEARAASASRRRSVSPITGNVGSPGFARGSRGPNSNTSRGNSRSPSPTSKFTKKSGPLFGASSPGGRPGKLKRKVHKSREAVSRDTGSSHRGGDWRSEEVDYQKNADAALLTSLLRLQDEMDRTQRNM